MSIKPSNNSEETTDTQDVNPFEISDLFSEALANSTSFGNFTIDPTSVVFKGKKTQLFIEWLINE